MHTTNGPLAGPFETTANTLTARNGLRARIAAFRLTESAILTDEPIYRMVASQNNTSKPRPARRGLFLQPDAAAHGRSNIGGLGVFDIMLEVGSAFLLGNGLTA